MKSQLYIEYSPLRYLGEKDSDLFTNNEEPAYAVPSPFLRQPFPSSFFVALAPSSFLEVCLPLKGGRDYLPLFNLYLLSMSTLTATSIFALLVFVIERRYFLQRAMEQSF